MCTEDETHGCSPAEDRERKEDGSSQCHHFRVNTERTACPPVRYLDGRGSGQRLGETDHAHVIGVLFQTASVLVTAVQAG